MNLPGYAIRIILVILFFVAVGARFASTNRSTYPYFKGASAMNYRNVIAVAEGRDLDGNTKKSNWPEGYRPARVRAAGVAYLAGYSFRLAKYLSEIDARKFCRRFLVLFFALTVFTIYAITFNLWRSQSAGLLAAFLVGLFPPLLEVTNGKTFTQVPFALVLVTLHLLLLQKYAKDSSWKKVFASSAIVFFLLATWDIALYYVVAVVCIAVLFFPLRLEQKRWLAAVHLIAFIAAAFSVPHLKELRAAFSWQAAFLVASCWYAFVPGRLTGRFKAVIFVVLVGAAITVAATPLRAGAEESVPGLKYVYYRLRFLFEKPYDPQMLPPVVRYLWSADHASPSAHALLNLFFPLLFFVPAIVMTIRSSLLQDEPGTLVRRRVIVALGVAGAGCLMFLIDRSAVALASVAVMPTLGLGMIGFHTQLKSRGPFLAVGAFLILIQLLSPLSAANTTLQIAKRTGVAHQDKSTFLWVSLENTDRELIRFVASRTSVSNPFLGHPDITAVLLAFSGRTSVLLPGGYSHHRAQKHVDLVSYLYGDEEKLYARCRELDIKYVLYSIDYLLDSSRCGPAYLAGVTAAPENCTAVAMHFSPESLTHFNLVYENHHYRLYKVTDEIEPIFATDHPPVYQREILEKNGDTYESFHDRIIQLMLAFSRAQAVMADGNYADALHLLSWCIQQAPHYTNARIALGSTLLELDRFEEAREVLLSVIRYAPDNPLALYYAAYALARLDDRETAKRYLEILSELTYDQDLLSRAKLLEAFIEQGVPMTSEPRETDPE